MLIKMETAEQPPSADMIYVVERHLGLTLPGSYIAALSFINGARPEHNEVVGDEAKYSVAGFFELTKLPYQKSLQDQFNQSSRVPDAYDGCGKYFSLSTNQDEAG